MATINERVKTLRNILNLTQKDFAEEIGVTNAHISKIEKSKTIPSQSLVKLICATFDVNEKWLVNGEDEIFVEERDIQKVLNDLLQPDSTLLTDLSVLLTKLTISEKHDAFDILIVLKWLLSFKYESETQRRTVLKVMRDIFNYSYYALVEPYQDSSIDLKSVVEKESEWRKLCEESAQTIKSVFLCNDTE